MELNFTWEINSFLKRLTIASDNFSNGRYRYWQAGTIDSRTKLKNIKAKRIHAVDCKKIVYANFVLKKVLEKGMKKNKGSGKGRFVFVCCGSK